MVDWPSAPETLEALPSAAAVSTASEGGRVRVNLRFTKLYAPAPTEMAPAEYEALLRARIGASDRAELDAFLERLGADSQAEESVSVELAAPPEGRRITLWSAPVQNGEGRVIGRLTLHREERERTESASMSELDAANRELRSAQAALLRSEKMASLGHLVAGVAHEINTPVGSIHSNGDLMVRAVERLRKLLTTNGGLEENADLARTVDVLEEIGRVNRTACERITELVRSLKNFARPEESERVEVDLHEGLENTLTLVHHELKNRVEVIREYGELPPVECFPNQINQVFMNILVNASQAIEGKGEIRVRTWQEGDVVRVQISDDGVGIHPENLERIFEPGFTTKSAGEGTGLGLAICSRIVEAHGGDIEVRSTPGEGTTFTVTLPVTSSSTPGSDSAEEGDSTTGEPGDSSGPKER